MNLVSRRDLLKIAGAGAVAAALPFGTSTAQASTASVGASTGSKTNSAVYRFRVGDWEAISIAGGLWKVPAPQQPMFAPQASAESFAEALDSVGLTGDSFALFFNILLLRTGKETILIDAGYGGKQPTHFDLAANLALAGIKPSEISMVFLSHAHGDHMGGMLDDSGKPVFARAQHFCSATERAFWTSKTPDFSKSRRSKEDLAAGVQAAQRVFESLRFTDLRETTALPEGFSVLPAPGHTPGHINFRFESKGETLHHIVDLAHHYAVMLPHPEWTVSFDVDEALAAKTRKEIFARLAAEKTPVFGYHLPSPGIGWLKANGEGGYRWAPRPWEPGV